MDKLHKRLRKAEKEIKAYQAEINSMETQPYYIAFPADLERHRKDMQIELKHLLSVESCFLYSMRIAINKKLALISEKEREITLKLNAEC